MPAGQQPQQRIVATGVVKSTQDPKKLGRVQVQLQNFTPESSGGSGSGSGAQSAPTLPWIRILWPLASQDFGQVILPEEGDEVVVLQGAGNSIDQMYCLGGVYNGKRTAPYANDDGKNDRKILKTRSGNLLELNDKSGGEKITLQTSDGATLLELDHAGGKITLKCDTQIQLVCSGGKVVIDCGSAQINASGDVSVTAPTISLSGAVDLG